MQARSGRHGEGGERVDGVNGYHLLVDTSTRPNCGTDIGTGGLDSPVDGWMARNVRPYRLPTSRCVTSRRRWSHAHAPAPAHTAGLKPEKLVV